MINSVRNTVLAVCNKNNYGYISPSDFNLYAKQAQLDIFEKLIFQYNYQINKENAHMAGSGMADTANAILSELEPFFHTEELLYISGSDYRIPPDSYILVDVYYKGGGGYVQSEKLPQSKANRVIQSNLTAPTLSRTAYSSGGYVDGFKVRMFPSAITGANDVDGAYLRYPADPKWTYVSLQNGEPMFNATAGDYQDFQLSAQSEPKLVMKILQYAGVSIRESEVYRFYEQEERADKGEEQ